MRNVFSVSVCVNRNGFNLKGTRFGVRKADFVLDSKTCKSGIPSSQEVRNSHVLTPTGGSVFIGKILTRGTRLGMQL